MDHSAVPMFGVLVGDMEETFRTLTLNPRQSALIGGVQGLLPPVLIKELNFGVIPHFYKKFSFNL